MQAKQPLHPPREMFMMQTKVSCNVTHRQLVVGICPWCSSAINNENSSTPPKAPHDRRWNISAMAQAMEDDDQEVRLITASNLLLHGPNLREALPVLRFGIRNSNLDVRRMASDALVRLGSFLSVAEAKELEQTAKGDPADLALRISLIGYYYLLASDPDWTLIRQKHILWIIENAPDFHIAGCPEVSLDQVIDKEGFKMASELWKRHAENRRDNLKVLGNAARFFNSSEPGLAERLLVVAHSMDAQNPKWHERLAENYEIQMTSKSGNARTELASKAINELENALAKTHDGEDQALLYLRIAKAALEKGDLGQARCYAGKLLALREEHEFSGWIRNLALHHGNIILGRIALKSRDIETARKYLMEAAKSVDCAFGPNLKLASELLEIGQRDVVIRYIKLCTLSWEHADQITHRWLYQLEKGENPDLGNKLGY